MSCGDSAALGALLDRRTFELDAPIERYLPHLPRRTGGSRCGSWAGTCADPPPPDEGAATLIDEVQSAFVAFLDASGVDDR